jgi:AraC-like DNA-binding protein
MKITAVTILCKNMLQLPAIEAVRPEGLQSYRPEFFNLKDLSLGAGLFLMAICDKLHACGVAAMIDLQYEASDERLAPFVSSFYWFDYPGNSLNELERADRAQFRIMLHGQGYCQFAAGHRRPTYDFTIIGPTTAPFTAQSSEPLRVMGWGMTPLGWAALMGNEAEAWVDECFDARRIYGDALNDLRQQLITAPDVATRFALTKAAATEIFAQSESAAFEFTATVDQWLLATHDHAIETLMASTALSIRQLERMTTRYYGMPPKKLARKYRALLAAHRLAVGDSLDDTELGLSFYDQSHLIREVKQFTGLTPSQLKSGKSNLTSATMHGRGKLAGKVSPLISES